MAFSMHEAEATLSLAKPICSKIDFTKFRTMAFLVHKTEATVVPYQNKSAASYSGYLLHLPNMHR